MGALIHLDGMSNSRPWEHDLAHLYGQLLEPHNIRVGALLEPGSIEALQPWGRDAQREWPETPTFELFLAAAETACDVAAYTVEQFQSDLPIASEILQQVDTIIDDYILDMRVCA